MNDRALQNLDQAIRQLAVTVANNTAVALAALPQFYTLDDLAARYRMGRDTVQAHLIEAQMIPSSSPKGVKIRVPLESVLQLDKILKERKGS